MAQSKRGLGDSFIAKVGVVIALGAGVTLALRAVTSPPSRTPPSAPTSPTVSATATSAPTSAPTLPPAVAIGDAASIDVAEPPPQRATDAGAADASDESPAMVAFDAKSGAVRWRRPAGFVLGTFSADSRYFFWKQPERVTLIDVVTGKTVREHETSGEGFSPKGTYYVIRGGGYGAEQLVVRTATGATAMKIQATEPAFSQDETRIDTFDGVLEVPSGRVVGKMHSASMARPRRFAGADAIIEITESRDGGSHGIERRAIVVYNVATGAERARWESPAEVSTEILEISPDGRRVSTVSMNAQRTPEACAVVDVFKAKSEDVPCAGPPVSFSLDGSAMMYIDRALSTFVRHDLNTNTKAPFVVDALVAAPHNAMAWSLDGRLMAAFAHVDGPREKIGVWQVGNAPVRLFAEGQGAPYRFGISPDGKTVIVEYKAP